MNFHTDYNKFPLELEFDFSGWRGRAYDLMRCGWDIESMISHETYSTTLVLRNKSLNVEGISMDISVVQWSQMVDPRLVQTYDLHDVRYNIRVQLGNNIRASAYRMTPEVVSSSMPIELGQFVQPDEFVTIISAFGDKEPDEIVIEQRPDVISLLNQIKDLQEPRAKELLAKERKRGKVESFETSANIIAIR